MEQDFNNLDRFLNARQIPDAPPFLAERIIAAARGQRNLSLWDIFTALLPKPALTFASLLLLGVLIGWQAPVNNDETQNTDTASFFYDDSEELL